MLNDTDNHLKQAQSLCPIKMTTGFPCPSCGITKSIVSFYEGNVIESLTYHVLGPAMVFFCLFTVILLLVELKSGKEYFNQYLYNKKAAYGLAVFLASYHLVRLYYFMQQHTLQEILKESLWQ